MWHRLIFMLFIISVFSQQCINFDSNSAPASGSECLPYLSPQVYVPLIPNAISIIDDIFNKTIFWRIKAAKVILPFNCYDATLSLLCNAAYPPCNFTSEGSFTIPVSYPSCRSSCTRVNDVCSKVFSFYEQSSFNCSRQDEITGESQWPEDLRTNSFFGVQINTSCIKELPKSEPDVSEVQCPAPLNLVENPTYYSPRCDVPCPDPTWTMHQWHTIAAVEFSFGLASAISLSFLIIHYLADPRCRNTAKRFQLYSFITLFLFCVGFVIGGPDPVTSIWCDSPTKPSTFHRPLCGTQAFLMMVFGLSSAIWWAISSSIMFKQLQNHMYQVSAAREIFYHFVAFGLPLIPFGIGVNMEVVQFLVLTPFCFAQRRVDHSINYQYVLFYIPLAVPMMIAIGYILATMMKIIRHMAQMKMSYAENQTHGGVSLLQVNVRLFIWCASLFLFFFTIMSYRTIIEITGQRIQVEAYAWAKCRISGELGLGPFTECPHAIFPHQISYPGTLIHYIIGTSIGSFTFLAFGTTKTIYHFWLFVARLVYKRDWANLHRLLTDEKALAYEMQKSRKEVNVKNDENGKT